MSGSKKSKGRPFIVIPLKPETAACLKASVENFRMYLREDAPLFLRMPEEIERATQAFDHNLVLVVYSRSRWDEEGALNRLHQLVAQVMGWKDVSPLTEWIERSFKDAVMIAFKANDEGFSSQWAILQELLTRSHFKVQDAIADAYETLSKILHNPPACPADMDSTAEQICHMILTPPFHRPPSNPEIRSYLEWFEGRAVNREQVRDECKKRKWELSHSTPFPGFSESCGMPADESGDSNTGEPFS
jgi:hypothetical protein